MGTVGKWFGGFWTLVRKWPVRFQAVLVAGVALGTAFGLKLDGAQVGAITAFTAAVLSFLTESAVTPTIDPTVPSGTLVTVTNPDPQVPDKVVTAR